MFMEEKTIDRVLKLLYFFIGIEIAVFGYIVSLLVNIEFKSINIILAISLAGILGSIFILIYFVLLLIFKNDNINREIIRRFVGYSGFFIGIALGGLFVWVIIYSGFPLK